ncbi:beta/gamma crystallin-related protein [Shimazuella kribbensis]|uniref:beta/gamma crystallin-related protein n=1 Tax=Shimazuella kribbensis TaxID=139808 RepID=UPI0003F59441|nr:beta/gamma crystallin-related protein [Shimazuella kribbensis]
MIKNLFNLSVFALIGSFFILDTASANNCLTLYEKDNFEGKHITICQSIPDLSKLKFNDKVRSMKNPDRVWVTLYEHKNYKGSKYFTKAASENFLDPIFSSIEYYTEEV